jgi:hypothetical protein
MRFVASQPIVIAAANRKVNNAARRSLRMRRFRRDRRMRMRTLPGSVTLPLLGPDTEPEFKGETAPYSVHFAFQIAMFPTIRKLKEEKDMRCAKPVFLDQCERYCIDRRELQ